MLFFFEKRSGQYGCEVVSSLLTYHVKTRVFVYTGRDDYKGYGGPFLSETFELPLVGISCQLSASFQVGSLLPQTLRVVVLFSLFSMFSKGER